MNVSYGLVCCLRNRVLRDILSISPLHHEFRTPQLHPTSFNCSAGVEPQTFTADLNDAVYAPFKPYHPMRAFRQGSWYGVSWCLFIAAMLLLHGRVYSYKEVLQPVGPSSFTLLGWFRLVHWPIFSLLPPVGSFDRVSVPMGPSSQNPYPSSVSRAVTPPTA